MTMIIERYTPGMSREWNRFVAESKNATFLHDRNYMDYHADRFPDHSLIARDDKGAVAALLPASAAGPELVSHGGLTFGGLLTGGRMSGRMMLDVFHALLVHLKQTPFSTLVYKNIPWIYHRIPAEEDLYAMFQIGAKLYRRSIMSVVDTASRPRFRKGRKYGVSLARKAGLQAGASTDWPLFWDILTFNLESNHGVKPVHTLEEIQMLHGRFPDNIKLFTCCGQSGPVAGTVIYETPRVAHVQYIAASAQGKDAGALDLLFHHLITEVYAGKLYFDFGISDLDNGRRLNAGLIEHKEGFGARTVVHDHYEIDIAACNPDAILEVLP